MDEMIQPNEMVETDVTSAKRRSTGSRFSLNLVPQEFSEFECEYENPKYDLKIGFHARWIYEQKELERNGKLVPWPLCTGAILVEGELKQLLVTAVGGRASEAKSMASSTIVTTCYPNSSGASANLTASESSPTST
jgi:hypothetical protein